MELFKKKFVERYSNLTDWEKFKEYSLKFLERSIRINTLKISIKKLVTRLEDWALRPIPWCKEGFWVKHEAGRRDIGNLLEHKLGYFYVQEAASMIPAQVLEPKPTDLVLDMCAAPGSKTTQIAQYMKNQGLIIANDYKGRRIKALGLNLQRCGVLNCIITLMRGQNFYKKGLTFDKVLLDAPCSGTGAIRKSLKTLKIWNPNMIKRLATQQRVLIDTAFAILKPRGILVYSTCSLEPEENEGVIDFLLSKYDNAVLEKIELNIKSSPPILGFEGNSYNKEIKKCLRIWPQDNNTEGFFVAKIKKL